MCTTQQKSVYLCQQVRLHLFNIDSTSVSVLSKSLEMQDTYRINSLSKYYFKWIQVSEDVIYMSVMLYNQPGLNAIAEINCYMCETFLWRHFDCSAQTDDRTSQGDLSKLPPWRPIYWTTLLLCHLFQIIQYLCSAIAIINPFTTTNIKLIYTPHTNTEPPSPSTYLIWSKLNCLHVLEHKEYPWRFHICNIRRI